KKKVEKEAAEAAEKEKSKPVTDASGNVKPAVSGSGSGQSAKAEAPKTIKSVSIKSFTKPGNGTAGQKNEKAAQGVVEGNNGIDPTWEETFSPEQLQRVWNAYARLVENSNPRLFSMLTAHSPRLKGDRVVVFPLKNETQEVELLKGKKGLFDFLKKELRNAKLVLETEYIREESGPQKAYTSADKYKVLAEKNPTLDKLRSMLNLDIE
uniref:hypothetical protein n=2 Tax=Marinilabilia salmonicolor TaxID=989 RepID=UPI00029B2CCE